MGLGRITQAEARRLADAFREGEDVTNTPRVRAMIDAAVRRIHSEFAKLPVRVVWTSRDPYASYAEMRDQVLSSGVLYIWTGASEVPMWDPQTNWMARAVHDWQHISDQFDFTMDGEYDGFRSAARRAPQLAPIYLSEIAMQAAVANVYGDFAPDQKIVIPSDEQMRQMTQLGAVPSDEAEVVDLVSTMLAVLSPEETATMLALMGANEEGAVVLIEAAQINDALIEGQMG